jgi:hypothetical protein
MPTSIFLARLMGPVALAVGVAALVNAAVLRQVAEQFLASHALIYLAGLLGMVAGVAIILTHNLWVGDWRVVITIIGWLMAIGGAVRLILPQRAEAAGHWFLKRPATQTAAAAIWLAVGALLTFFGYFR